MTTVYVVTSGSYDDYCIEGVFSTKELAEEFIKAPNTINECKYFIKEYELNNLFSSELYFKMEDIIYYWECEFNTSSAFGRKEGEYSVTKKAIAKQYVNNVNPYNNIGSYFLCTSFVSESDVINKAYNYYQEYLNEEEDSSFLWVDSLWKKKHGYEQ